LRVNDDCKNPQLGPRDAHDRVGQEGRAETFALVIHCDGQPSHESRRDYWLAGKLARDLRRELIEEYRWQPECSNRPPRWYRR
jgi:hypothetical protein